MSILGSHEYKIVYEKNTSKATSKLLIEDL